MLSILMVSVLEFLVNSVEGRNYTAYKLTKVLCKKLEWCLNN